MTATAKQVADGRDSKFSAIPLTSTRLEEAAAKAFNQPGLDSEFCRPGDCNRLFGLKRGMVYGLEKEGLIKTVSLRRPGQIKGVKLVHVGSVRAFLHDRMNAGQAV